MIEMMPIREVTFAMRRRHLFEFEDQRWFPSPLRNMTTDFLQQSLMLRMSVYRPTLPLITKVLQAQETNKIVDLCSGATGPWAELKPALDEALGSTDLTLTDKHPNFPAFQGLCDRLGTTVHFLSESVDATEVPDELDGVRTLFTSFHHFSPLPAKRILGDAFRQRSAICVFEFTERRWKTVLSLPPLALLFLAFTTPSLRPRRLSRFLLTYLLPVVPCAVIWDGIVSNLRTYQPEELDELVHDYRSPDYVWETGQLHADKGPTITYLIGHRTAIGGSRETGPRR
ncbi:class I SAM-dependent methyltransferase [Rhodococcus wratislaviensis]|nr:class I SAM-dependent methyltransferase [Rhodococcus wratislaviensis]